MEWVIDLKRLPDGPLVMAMFQKHGNMLWGSNNTQTITLARALHNYLKETEEKNWKDVSKECDIDLILKEVGEYNIHDPWQPYGHFNPRNPNPEHLVRLKREGRTPPPPEDRPRIIGLAEPEKAQMSSSAPVTTR